MLLDLAPGTVHQGELDLEGDDENADRSRLMTVMDALNGRFGKDTVHVASTGVEGPGREWGMRQERRTPHYTTSWNEMPVARA